MRHLNGDGDDDLHDDDDGDLNDDDDFDDDDHDNDCNSRDRSLWFGKLDYDEFVQMILKPADDDT